jgi:cytoskeletal protein CcmA (bactofilin family)
MHSSVTKTDLRISKRTKSAVASRMGASTINAMRAMSKIIGQGLKIISHGTLLVDGEVEGDVEGSAVIIGELGKVTGTIAAERVVVRGQISGIIRAAMVTLLSTSLIDDGM